MLGVVLVLSVVLAIVGVGDIVIWLPSIALIEKFLAVSSSGRRWQSFLASFVRLVLFTDSTLKEIETASF